MPHLVDGWNCCGVRLDQLLSPKAKAILSATILLKVVLFTLFSSGYKEHLFIPFVTHFIENGGNPWESGLGNLNHLEFPYPPLMLYILSLFLYPATLFADNDIIKNFFYGLPLLLSDIAIFCALISLFQWRKTEIYIFYFISPIVIYASYLHGQLDIIPTAFVFSGLVLLTKKRFVTCFIMIGLAISTKMHTVAIVPLIVFYLINQKKYIEVMQLIGMALLIPLFFMSPFISSTTYQDLVLNNPKQRLVFDTFIPLKDVKVYLPILVTLLVYLRFAAFKKINTDLLMATVGTLFSAFLVFIEASPGWFIWIVPFFTVFYIRHFNGVHQYFYYLTLSLTYLAYYLFYYQYEHQQLMFLGNDISVWYGPRNEMHSVIFTLLEASLIFSVYQFYKNGIASNNIYTMNKSFVLGVGGDSGAGKSTLIDGLRRLLGNELLQVEGDGDHKWERGDEKWQYITHLNPKANFLHNQAENIADLKTRRTIKRSDYMHDTGKFSEQEKVSSKNFIVIAGLHTFYLPKMRNVIDLKIFLDLDENLRVHWKMIRDMKHRGHSREKVLDSLEKRSEDSKKYIQPQKQFADIIIKYYPINAFEIGVESEIELGLKVTVNASVHIEEFVRELKESSVKVNWNYSDDLQTQELDFQTEPQHINYHLLATKIIENAGELTEKPKWDTGYAGAVQFMMLMVISETLKEKAAKHD